MTRRIISTTTQAPPSRGRRWGRMRDSGRLDRRAGGACSAGPILGRVAGELRRSDHPERPPDRAPPQYVECQFRRKHRFANSGTDARGCRLTGSACHAGSVTLSPVLAAMGVPIEKEWGRSASVSAARRPGMMWRRCSGIFEPRFLRSEETSHLPQIGSAPNCSRRRSSGICSRNSSLLNEKR